jgi:hypothetical protein
VKETIRNESDRDGNQGDHGDEQTESSPSLLPLDVARSHGCADGTTAHQAVNPATGNSLAFPFALRLSKLS